MSAYTDKMREIVAHVDKYSLDNRKHQRLGQASFNGLYQIAPDIADSIRDTSADPFYDNSLIPNFWVAVSELVNWRYGDK